MITMTAEQGALTATAQDSRTLWHQKIKAEQQTLDITGKVILFRDLTNGSHNNTTRTTYNGEYYLRCLHENGLLTGTYVSPVYDRGSSARYLVYLLADVVVTGVGNTWDALVPVPMTWNDLDVSRTWSEIFNLTSGPQVKMRLLYGGSSPPTSIVEKLEILTAIVTGRYFQIEIEISDPSDEVYAFVENYTLKFCQ